MQLKSYILAHRNLIISTMVVFFSLLIGLFIFTNNENIAPFVYSIN